MSSLRVLGGLVLCSAAAHAQAVDPLILRPLTMPGGKGSFTLHGAYTNWDLSKVNATLEEPFAPSLTGETLAAGFDFAVTDHVQLGLATALPVNPGFAFGSILASASVSAESRYALRLDVGYERVGVNGNGDFRTDHLDRFFGGLGVPIKVRISSALAFVSGRTGAIQFGHFNNVGVGGLGIYTGATRLSDGASADLLVVESGNENAGSSIGINLPLGLLLQPDPHFALTLQAGYSVVFGMPVSQGGGAALHFVPVGVEAIVSPSRFLDLGARFFLDGYVAHTGAGSGANPGYFDQRTLTLWFQLNV